MGNNRIAWRVNGLPLPRNPSVFITGPTKTVDYKRAVHGEEIRVAPDKNIVDRHLTIGWQRLEEQWRNMFYDLFVRDEKFRLQTHLSNKYTSEYLVKVDEYDEEYVNSATPQWNVTLGLRVLDGINDPIIRQEYKQTPHLFVVDNRTNSTIYNANLFLVPKNEIKNPRITQTFWNLLKNPGFEAIDGHRPLEWVDPDDAWKVDIINFYEGERCVGTSSSGSPIYQEVWCPEGEHLTVMFAMMGLPGGGKVKATLEYLNSSDAVINEYSETVDVPGDHQTHWFSTSEPTPPETRKVRLKFEKASQDSSYIIIDMAMLRLGASEREPTWTNDRHRTLIYPNSLVRGETLDMNLGLQVATKHGSGPTLPRGGSVFHFDDSFVSQDGIQPEDGYVASLRPNEGKFGGAVAVEEGTTNLVDFDVAFRSWSSNNSNMASLTTKTGRHSFRVQGTSTVPGAYSYIYPAYATTNVLHSASSWVRNLNSKPLEVRLRIRDGSNGEYLSDYAAVVVPPGQELPIGVTSYSPVSLSRVTVSWSVYSDPDDGTVDAEIYMCQLEAKPFPTSFVDGTRPHGFLAYKKHLSITEGFTVRLYARRVN